MNKNIIIGVTTLLVVALMGYTASQGRAFQGGEAAKIIENVASKQTATQENNNVPAQKSDRDIEAEKLKALKDKAGNVALFKVSDNYKRKCASCHGIDGKGAVGLPIFGQEASVIYSKMIEYKEGKRQNPIMRSAIMHLNEADFKELSQEVSEFKAREAALN